MNLLKHLLYSVHTWKIYKFVWTSSGPTGFPHFIFKMYLFYSQLCYIYIKLRRMVWKQGVLSSVAEWRVCKLLLRVWCLFHTKGSQTWWHVRINKCALKHTDAWVPHVCTTCLCLCVCCIASKCSKWANYANWLHYKVMGSHLSWARNLNPFLYLRSAPFPISPGTYPKPLSLFLVLLSHPYL